MSDLTQSEMREVFRRKVKTYLGAREFAKSKGFGQANMEKVFYRQREVSAELAKALGYERVITYRRVAK